MDGKLGRGVPYHAAPSPEIVAELIELGQLGQMPYTHAAAMRRRDQLLARRARMQAAKAQREFEEANRREIQGE